MSTLGTPGSFTEMILLYKNLILRGIYLGIFLVLLGLLIWYIVEHRKVHKSTPLNVKTMTDQQTAYLESVADTIGQKMNKTKEQDTSLLNLQPLTVKESGLIGPIASGVFEERVFIKNALKSGIRSFVLSIDQYSGTAKDRNLFPLAGEPCLLHRDDSGGLISLNAGSILKFSTALAELAFSGSFPMNTEPVILILHGENGPDPINNPKDYLTFYSKVAEQLNPLIPFHLGLTPGGDYHRQGLENDLFTGSFKSFEKKVIMMSTIDTSLFRNVKRLNIPLYTPYKDLDFWVHARLYREGVNSKLGRYITMDDFTNMTPEGQETWAQAHKGYFTCIIPKRMVNPTDAVFKILVNKMGINVVPLDIVSPAVNTTVVTLGIWGNKTWKMKSYALQV